MPETPVKVLSNVCAWAVKCSRIWSRLKLVRQSRLSHHQLPKVSQKVTRVTSVFFFFFLRVHGTEVSSIFHQGHNTTQRRPRNSYESLTKCLCSRAEKFKKVAPRILLASPFFACPLYQSSVNLPPGS